MTNENWLRPSDVNRVIAELKSDHAFKSRLLSDANSALTGIGVQIPPGLTVRVHENTESTLNVILPAEFTDVELSDNALEAVAGGVVFYRAQKGA